MSASNDGRVDQEVDRSPVSTDRREVRTSNRMTTEERDRRRLETCTCCGLSISNGGCARECPVALGKAPCDGTLRDAWREAGGEFFGPNVETGGMPEAKLLPFLRSLIRTTVETSDALSKCYDAFMIGSDARTPQTLLANIENASRRSACLSAIEREFFTRTIDNDDGEDTEECDLNWGAEPAEYVEQFRAALTRSPEEPSPVTNSSGSVSRPVDVPALAVGADQPTGAAALEAGTSHPPRVTEKASVPGCGCVTSTDEWGRVWQRWCGKHWSERVTVNGE